ncbi:putative 37S ribosomal protein S26A, mitochondrial [Erysiphe neolycopersici]|uniref:Putative 37S ribosomal protein S26A, mitochondrial n=1 Tax=Erysiphe neolycopersici TaxID=212602 RepID=A0A420HQR5_9PEZI|nr:putative 37S ribosomal protein S26A, mitochondrial [Erysiphe neolycopersici]
MIRQRFPRRNLASKIFSRSVGSIPLLPQFSDLNHIPQFLSRVAFEISWKQQQSYSLEKLKGLISGKEFSQRSPKDIAINYARDPAFAAIFNYASFAHNNHFFFESLERETGNLEKMHEKLKEQIIKSFGSIETLKWEMLETASAMFGPGFVWLVKDFENKYSILATYLAGSPYPKANYRLQRASVQFDLPEKVPEHISDHLKNIYAGQATNSVGGFGPHSKEQRTPPGAPEGLTPILCVNVWQHVYLPDYGVLPEIRGGKPRYLENWWKKIDWKIVSQRAVGQNTNWVR